jgi:hypothetical protein
MNGRSSGKGRSVARRSAIEVQGVKVIQQKLKRMDDGTVQELKRVYFYSANLVARNALPRIPVRSGLLNSSMRVTTSKRGGWVRAGNKRQAPYAGPIHFGWPNRPNQAKEWQGGPIAPNPFLYAALDARREQVERAFFDGITRLARKKGLA